MKKTKRETKSWDSALINNIMLRRDVKLNAHQELKPQYLPSSSRRTSRTSCFNRVGLIIVTVINILAGIALLKPISNTSQQEHDNIGTDFAEISADRHKRVATSDVKSDRLTGDALHELNYTATREMTSSPSKPSTNDLQSINPHSQSAKNDKWAGIPKVALLMSFPNSGTSYTLSNVRLTSRRATASHYCNSGSNSTYKAVFPKEITAEGPHLIHAADELEMPDKYILTKTHCGGFCMDCSPSGYAISPYDFEDECFKVCNGATTRHKERRTYSPKLVGKVVHLFRSPFDNVISRFHLHLKNSPKRNDTIDLEVYTRDAKGLQAFCSDLDLKYRRQDKEIYSPKVYQLAKKVPCHADFLRYVQWHNFAFDMIRYNPALKEVPVHVLHYQDFHQDYNNTVTKLLNFLELSWRDRRVNATTFHWKDYSEYFDKSQRRAAMKFMLLGASPQTKNEIKRYAP